MEKGKKLKLKRKIKKVQEHKDNANIVSEQSTNGAAADNEIAIDCVTITSESDNEEPQDKERKKVATYMTHSDKLKTDNKARNFLAVTDPSLRELREFIMKVSREQGCQMKVNNFPPHIHEYENACKKEEVQKENKSLASTIQERINYEFPPLANGAELAPFPDMCDWCRRRKPVHGTCDNRSKQQTQINGKTCDNSRGHGMVLTKHNEPDAKQLHVSKHIDEQTVANTGKCTSYINDKNICLENDVASNGHSSTVECRDAHNNSHLMRDRNSNYYSLQSRNTSQKKIPELGSTKFNATSKVKNQRSEQYPTSTSNADACDKNQEIQKIELKIESEMSKETFNLAFDSDSDFENLDEINKESISACSVNSSNKLNRNNSLTNQPRTSPKHIKTHEKEVEHHFKDATIGRLFTQNKDSKVKNQPKTTTAIIKPTPRKETVPLLCTFRRTNQSATGTSKTVKEPSLQNCPLCQMEFAQSTSQIDIDGHIAACLSAADDDVMW